VIDGPDDGARPPQRIELQALERAGDEDPAEDCGVVGEEPRHLGHGALITGAQVPEPVQSPVNPVTRDPRPGCGSRVAAVPSMLTPSPPTSRRRSSPEQAHVLVSAV
jgi:hypothetical protein